MINNVKAIYKADIFEYEDGKIDISLDMDSIQNAREITTSENSGITLKKDEDNIDISLNKSITYFLNGGTSADI